MIGVNIYEGDWVVFAAGEVGDSGNYVIRIADVLLVKRVQFNYIEKKLTIISENPQHPERIESAEEDNVEIVGRVIGWIHSAR